MRFSVQSQAHSGCENRGIWPWKALILVSMVKAQSGNRARISRRWVMGSEWLHTTFSTVSSSS